MNKGGKMRYLVDLTQRQADEIGKLINTGKYQTVAQFICAAVENQIYIETSEESLHHQFFAENSGIETVTVPKPVFKNENIMIMLKEIQSKPKTVPMPAFNKLTLSSYFKAPEEKTWLWGQMNKILPIKIGLRVLYANIENEQWIELEEYAKRSAEIAAELGTIIRKYEDSKGKKRYDRISAGLPDKKEFKSKERYKNHFLGYMRKDEALEGAMPFLRFVNLKKDEKDKALIGLTKAGLDFAQLENSVLDLNNFDSSFTAKEVDFYLDHILKNVIGESMAIKWLLLKLKNDIAEREKLNEELKKEFGHIWKNAPGNNVSDAVINTQRAGLMARMFELGLIEREKQGLNVTYKVSSRGETFLKTG